MEFKSTRLRYIKSVDLDGLMTVIESLPFKIEIKGSVQKEGKYWVIFFVLPETPGIELNNITLD